MSCKDPNTFTDPSALLSGIEKYPDLYDRMESELRSTKSCYLAKVVNKYREALKQRGLRDKHLGFR